MKTLGTPFADVMPALPNDKYEALRADIEQAGLIKSIVVDENNNILDGHHRYRACSELGLEIKTETYRGLGDEQDKRIRIMALNLTEREMSGDERRRLGEKRKRAALELLSAGRGVRDVARLVGRPPSTIHLWKGSAIAVQSEQKSQAATDIKKPSTNTLDITADKVNMTAGEQKAKALELFRSGVRIADISTHLDVRTGTVRSWVNNPETQASTRGRGGGQPRKLDDSDVKRLFDAGKSRIEIASELGVSLQTAGEYLKRLGLSSAGKRAQNQLAAHTSHAEAQADAWTVGADKIAATASISSTEQVAELSAALSRLSRAAATLKARLNKEAGKKE